MNHLEVLRALLQTSVFHGLTEADLREHLLRFEYQEVPEGSTVLEEGQENTTLYIIVKGRFRVVLTRKGGAMDGQRVTDIELGALRAGSCFGEFSLFDRAPVGATVIALEPSEIVRIDTTEVEELLGASPHVASVVYRNLIRELVGRIRRTNRDYDLLLALE